MLKDSIKVVFCQAKNTRYRIEMIRRVNMLRFGQLKISAPFYANSSFWTGKLNFWLIFY